jgi:syntaxin-binding protein 1
VLVVDEHSQKLLGSVLKQNDILQEQVPSMFALWCSMSGCCAYDSVPVIESIANNRERQQDMEALYLLMPTTENVDHIIGDFPTAVIELANRTRQPKYADRHTDHQYKAAHVFFVDGMFPAPWVVGYKFIRNESALRNLDGKASHITL